MKYMAALNHWKLHVQCHAQPWPPLGWLGPYVMYSVPYTDQQRRCWFRMVLVLPAQSPPSGCRPGGLAHAAMIDGKLFPSMTAIPVAADPVEEPTQVYQVAVPLHFDVA